MDKKKILIIDDDLQITKILRDYFNYENFEVFVAHDGQTGLEKIKNLEVDIIILDLMLPKKNGLDICRQLKPHNQIPIIILSAKNRENDRIKGLELGADDYLTKPFSPKELVLRVKNVLKRINNDQEQTELVFTDLIINREQRLVKVKKEEIALAPKEFDLLWQLASAPKTVFSREKLLELVWDFDYFGGIRTVDTHIKAIRNKLGAEVGNYVQTVWGIGYKFGVKY